MRKTKVFAVAIIVTLTLALGQEMAHSQQISRTAAIQEAATRLSAGFESGTRIAVVSMQADAVRMSDYLINEMIAAFVAMQGRYEFSVVDRAQLELTARELDFSMSGEVDDATQQLVGRRVGAQFIVTSAFESLGGFFRLRVQVIEVESAVIRDAYTASVQNDDVIAYLRGIAPLPRHGFAPSAFTTHNRFTGGQRWETFGLNLLLGGFGSLLVMDDMTGAAVQMIPWIVGFPLFFAGLIIGDIPAITIAGGVL